MSEIKSLLLSICVCSVGSEEAEDIRICFLLLLLAARWGDDYIKKVADTEFVLRTKESSKIRQSFILAQPQHFW